LGEGRKQIRNLGDRKKEKNLNLKIFLLLPGRRPLAQKQTRAPIFYLSHTIHHSPLYLPHYSLPHRDEPLHFLSFPLPLPWPKQSSLAFSHLHPTNPRSARTDHLPASLPAEQPHHNLASLQIDHHSVPFLFHL